MDCKKARVATYCRVSTKTQSKGLEAQELVLKRFVEVNRMLNVAGYKDFGISGAKSSRPDLDRLWRDIRAGKVDIVVVPAFSRFSRSTRELLRSLEEFEQLGVQFISVSEQIDTRTSAGRLVFSVIGAISQFEREILSERVKSGLENARSKGKTLGRKRVRNDRIIRELYSQGLSQRRIAELVGVSKTTVRSSIKELENGQ